MNTTINASRLDVPQVRVPWREPGPGALRHDAGAGRVARVAVDVTDAELDSDVRAVLAALTLETAAPGDPAADLLVTDHPAAGTRAMGSPGAGEGVLVGGRDVPGGGVGVRTVRVAPDRARVDDDGEVIHLPSGTGDLVAALMAPTPVRAGDQVVVLGAVGGCGASTLAAAIAVRAASTRRTLLLETDPRGTGSDLLLGLEAEPGLRLEEVRAVLGGPDPDSLWAAVPKTASGLGVLARSRSGAGAAGQAPGPDGGTGAARSHRGAGGLVVSDAGTGADGRQERTGAHVVVTRADLQGAVAAGRALRLIPGAQLVVRTGPGDPLHAADVAEAAGSSRWHVLPEIRGVRRAVGAGELAGALSRGRPGGVRRLAVLADALLRGAVGDARG